MTAPDWNSLELSPERTRQVASFFEAYAGTALHELADIGYEPANEDDVFLEPPRVQLADLTDPSNPRFVLAADAASALREAGQWWLYLEPRRAARLLARSGRLFLDIGNPFGAYLLVVAGPWANAAPPYLAETISELTGAFRGAPVAPRPRFQPQQQLYLLLAAAGSAFGQELQAPLFRFADSSPQREGVAAVGSLGLPLRQLWGIARELLASERGLAPFDRVVNSLAAIGNRFAETISLAQTNRHLWENGAAPVDIGDIDLVGIATLTARKYGRRQLADAILDLAERERIDAVALAPLQAGLALAELGDGREAH